MRIKRFIAPDMRTALRMVRDEQGPDAVILSNRATAEGIEVVAATDYDEALVAQALRAAAPGLSAVPAVSSAKVAGTAIVPTSAVSPGQAGVETLAPAATSGMSSTSASATHSAPERVRANAGSANAVAAAAIPQSAAPAFTATTSTREAKRSDPPASRDSLMSRARSMFRRGDAVAEGPTLAELTASTASAAGTGAPSIAPVPTATATIPAWSAVPTPASAAFATAPAVSDAPARDAAARFEEMMAALMPSANTMTGVEASGAQKSADVTPATANVTPGASTSASATDTRDNGTRIPEAPTSDPDTDADYLIALATGTALAQPRSTGTSVDTTASTTAKTGVLHAIAGADPDPALAALRRELATMRQLMEQQMDQLSLERLRGSPARAAAFECLLGLGCETSLAQAIAGNIDPRLPPADIHAPMLAGLMGSLAIARHEPIEEGGVIALVGPTGAGKTTTAAKLAARFAARHRARDVALVSIDRERTGAREQLHALGRRLGVTVCDAENSDGLNQALEQLADYPLVLVDTAGYGVRDRALLRQILWLRSSSRLRSLLVLPANANPHDLGEIVRRYRPAAPEGVVLTKLDETSRLGASLSVFAEYPLPLAYTCAGQHVPDDLEPADADSLAALLRAQVAEQRGQDRGAARATAPRDAGTPDRGLADHVRTQSTLEKSPAPAVNPLAIKDRHAFA